LIGQVYLERGYPVTVLARWSGQRPMYAGFTRGLVVIWHEPRGGGRHRQAPRNVLIERRDGSRDVRPFRGLRRAG
jgi:hypothetical protein